MSRIYKRGQNWCLDYRYKSKRIRKVIGPHRDIAVLALKDIEVRIAKEEHLGVHEYPHIVFADYIREYLQYSKANKGKGTYQTDCSIAKRLVRNFGESYLFQITAKQIEQYKNRTAEEIQKNTVNRELAVIKHLFRKAVEWGYLAENPATSVKAFKKEPGRVRFLEAREIERLLGHCSPILRPIVITALNTGMRKSEILNLKWANINLRLRTIVIDKTKNNERRVIPINKTLFDQLIQMPHNEGYIFSVDGEKPYSNTWSAFDKARQKAELSDFRFHDLRHTFASHLVMAGVSLRAVQQLLGHRDITMTMRYSHLSRQYLQEAVGRLSLSLSGELQNALNSLKWHRYDTSEK